LGTRFLRLSPISNFLHFGPKALTLIWVCVCSMSGSMPCSVGKMKRYLDDHPFA